MYCSSYLLLTCVHVHVHVLSLDITPGIKVRSPRTAHSDQNDSIPVDIKSDPRFSNQPWREAQEELAKNKGRFLSSTITVIINCFFRHK